MGGWGSQGCHRRGCLGTGCRFLSAVKNSLSLLSLSPDPVRVGLAAAAFVGLLGPFWAFCTFLVAASLTSLVICEGPISSSLCLCWVFFLFQLARMSPFFCPLLRFGGVLLPHSFRLPSPPPPCPPLRFEGFSLLAYRAQLGLSLRWMSLRWMALSSLSSFCLC